MGTRFTKPKLSKEEQFDKYITNWLLDIPQKPWSPKRTKDAESEDAEKTVYDVFSRMK